MCRDSRVFSPHCQPRTEDPVLLYLDIETIADANLPLDLFVSKAALQGWPVEKYAALSPVLARIVCVGVATEDWSEALTGSEESILRGLEAPLGHAKQLVTFFGKGFDLPVLWAAYRRHGMAVPKFLENERTCKPWESMHVDLCEILSWNGKARRPSLQEACVAFGVNDPKGSGDGGNVQQLWQAGKIQEIADYCVRDLVATRELHKRLTQTKGGG